MRGYGDPSRLCDCNRAGTESLPVSDAGWLDLVNNDDLLVAVHGGRQSHSQAGAQRLGHFHQQRTRSTGYGVCEEGGEETTNSKWTSGIKAIQIKEEHMLESLTSSSPFGYSGIKRLGCGFKFSLSFKAHVDNLRNITNVRNNNAATWRRKN